MPRVLRDRPLLTELEGSFFNLFSTDTSLLTELGGSFFTLFSTDRPLLTELGSLLFTSFLQTGRSQRSWELCLSPLFSLMQYMGKGVNALIQISRSPTTP